MTQLPYLVAFQFSLLIAFRVECTFFDTQQNSKGKEKMGFFLVLLYFLHVFCYFYIVFDTLFVFFLPSWLRGFSFSFFLNLGLVIFFSLNLLLVSSYFVSISSFLRLVPSAERMYCCRLLKVSPQPLCLALV